MRAVVRGFAADLEKYRSALPGKQRYSFAAADRNCPQDQAADERLASIFQSTLSQGTRFHESRADHPARDSSPRASSRSADLWIDQITANSGLAASSSWAVLPPRIGSPLCREPSSRALEDSHHGTNLPHTEPPR